MVKCYLVKCFNSKIPYAAAQVYKTRMRPKGALGHPDGGYVFTAGLKVTVYPLTMTVHPLNATVYPLNATVYRVNATVYSSQSDPCTIRRWAMRAAFHARRGSPPLPPLDRPSMRFAAAVAPASLPVWRPQTKEPRSKWVTCGAALLCDISG